MKKIPLTRGEFAIVDDEDYEWLSQFAWQCQEHRRGNKIIKYATGRHWDKCKKKYYAVRMHRLIYEKHYGDIPKKCEIDHFNHNGLDNKKSNIRIASSQENSRNRLPNVGKSIKGVSDVSHAYQSRITSEDGVLFLGTFVKTEKGKEAAAYAYDYAAIELHGEFRQLNFPEQTEDFYLNIIEEFKYRPVNKKSKYLGVSLHKPGIWRTRVKQIHCGLYDSEEKAAMSYDRNALKILGKGAKLNFPELKSQYLKELADKEREKE